MQKAMVADLTPNLNHDAEWPVFSLRRRYRRRLVAGIMIVLFSVALRYGIPSSWSAVAFEIPFAACGIAYIFSFAFEVHMIEFYEDYLQFGSSLRPKKIMYADIANVKNFIPQDKREQRLLTQGDLLEINLRGERRKPIYLHASLNNGDQSFDARSFLNSKAVGA